MCSGMCRNPAEPDDTPGPWNQGLGGGEPRKLAGVYKDPGQSILQATGFEKTDTHEKKPKRVTMNNIKFRSQMLSLLSLVTAPQNSLFQGQNTWPSAQLSCR